VSNESRDTRSAINPIDDRLAMVIVLSPENHPDPELGSNGLKLFPIASLSRTKNRSAGVRTKYHLADFLEYVLLRKSRDQASGSAHKCAQRFRFLPQDLNILQQRFRAGIRKAATPSIFGSPAQLRGRAQKKHRVADLLLAYLTESEETDA